MKKILDCPACEEKDNCTMRCLSDAELKTYLKTATADELSRNQVIQKKQQRLRFLMAPLLPPVLLLPSLGLRSNQNDRP